MLCARVSSFKLTLEVWRVLEGRKSCSGRGNFQGASIPRYTHVKHEPIVKSDMNYYTAIIQIPHWGEWTGRVKRLKRRPRRYLKKKINRNTYSFPYDITSQCGIRFKDNYKFLKQSQACQLRILLSQCSDWFLKQRESLLQPLAFARDELWFASR